MSGLNYLAFVAAILGGFVFSSVWYVALAKQRAALSAAAAAQTRPPAWIVPVELLRTTVVAVVVAFLIRQLHIVDWAGALGLGLALWVAFPVILLSGSVIYEKVPTRLAAIHAGDWLGKLLLICVLVSLWR